MTKRPTSAKILHLNYKIEWVKASEMEDAYGMCASYDQVIRLRTNMAPERAFETVVHEFLHAYWEANGMPESANEEQVAGLVGTSVLLFVRDNPQWVRWLSSRLKTVAV